MSSFNTTSLGRWADEEDDFDLETYVRDTAHYSAPENSPEISSYGQVAARSEESAESHDAGSHKECDSSDHELDSSTNVDTGDVNEKEMFQDADGDEDGGNDDDENEEDERDKDDEEVVAHARYPPMQPRAPRPYYPSNEVVANMLVYGLANPCWSMDRLPRAALYENSTASPPPAVETEDTGAESESVETDSKTTQKAPVPPPWGPIVWPRWYNHQRWRNIKESMGYSMDKPMIWPSRLNVIELADKSSPTTDSGSPESSPHESTGEASTDATSPILEESATEATGLGIQFDEDFIFYPGRDIYIEANEVLQSEIPDEDRVLPENWEGEDEAKDKAADDEMFTDEIDYLPSENTHDVHQKLSPSAKLDRNDSPSDLICKTSSIWDDDDDDFDIEAYMQKPPPPPPTIEELGPLQQQADNSESAYEVHRPASKFVISCDSDSKSESAITMTPNEHSSDSQADPAADSTTYDIVIDASAVDATADSTNIDTTTDESGKNANDTADGEGGTPTDNVQANTRPAQPREKEPDWKIWLRRFKRRGRLAGGNELHEYILYRRQCIDDGEFLERNKYCVIWNDYKRFAGVGPLDVLNPSPLRKEIAPEEAEDIGVEEEEEVIPMPHSMKKLGRRGLRAQGIISMIDICGEWAHAKSLRSEITVPSQVTDHFAPGQARLIKELKLELLASEAAEFDADIVEQTVDESFEPAPVVKATEATKFDDRMIEQPVEQRVEPAPTEEIIEVADLCDKVVGDARHLHTDAGIVEPTEKVAPPERTSKKSTHKARKPKKQQSRNRDPETLTFCTKCKTTLLGMRRRSAALHINTCTGPAKDASINDVSSAISKNATHTTEGEEARIDSATPSEQGSRSPSPSTPKTESRSQSYTSRARLTATTTGLGRRQPTDLRALMVPATHTSEQHAVLKPEVANAAIDVEKPKPIPWMHTPGIFTAGFFLGVSMAALGWV